MTDPGDVRPLIEGVFSAPNMDAWLPRPPRPAPFDNSSAPSPAGAATADDIDAYALALGLDPMPRAPRTRLGDGVASVADAHEYATWWTGLVTRALATRYMANVPGLARPPLYVWVVDGVDQPGISPCARFEAYMAAMAAALIAGRSDRPADWKTAYEHAVGARALRAHWPLPSNLPLPPIAAAAAPAALAGLLAARIQCAGACMASFDARTRLGAAAAAPISIEVGSLGSCLSHWATDTPWRAVYAGVVAAHLVLWYATYGSSCTYQTCAHALDVLDAAAGALGRCPATAAAGAALSPVLKLWKATRMRSFASVDDDDAYGPHASVRSAAWLF